MGFWRWEEKKKSEKVMLDYVKWIYILDFKIDKVTNKVKE